jgi:hypothetical protein
VPSADDDDGSELATRGETAKRALMAEMEKDVGTLFGWARVEERQVTTIVEKLSEQVSSPRAERAQRRASSSEAPTTFFSSCERWQHELAAAVRLPPSSFV